MTKRPLCMSCVGMVLGVGITGICLRGTLIKIWIALILLCAVWIAWKACQKQSCLSVLFLLMFLAIGTIRMMDIQDGQREVPAQNKEKALLVGKVYDRREKSDKTVYYLSEVCFLEQGEGSEYSVCTIGAKSNYQGTCIAYDDSGKTISIGSTICFSGKISLFEKATNKGQFDAASYYRRQGIDFCVFQMQVLENDDNRDRFQENLCQLKRMLHNQLDVLAGEHASVLQAMLLGEKSEMDEDIRLLYQKSGISHVLVISGLHFSLIGMCLYQMLRRFGLSFAYAGGSSMCCLLLYGCMTGFGISAVRAFIMFALSVGAQILGREYDLPSALGASVLFLLIRNPYVLFEAGFLLSVGAVLGIILVIPVLEKSDMPVEEPLLKMLKMQKENPDKVKWKEVFKELLKRAWNGWKRGILSGIGIQLGTIPVLLYYFYEFATYGVLLNCLVLPLLPVVILGAIVALAVSFFVPAFGQVLMLPSVWVLELFEWLCKFVGKIPGAQLVTGQPDMSEIFAYYGILTLVISFLWLWKSEVAVRDGRVFRFLENSKEKWTACRLRLREKGAACYLLYGMAAKTLASLLYIGIFYGLFVWRESNGMEITMLDVGQGQAVYVRSGNQAVLYDGGSADISQVGKYRIAPFLKASGVATLDVIIVSHMDADHYNGVKQMLEEDLLNVKCLMVAELDKPDSSYMQLTELATRKGISVMKVSRGDVFSLGDAVCEILHPSSDYPEEDKNDASIVLTMDYQDFRILLTGDVESGGEEDILQSDKLRTVNVLQVAHHGSASSSTEEFLQTVRPDIALISCGKDNKYGHPNAKTIQNLEKIECEYHITMQEGSISMKIE